MSSLWSIVLVQGSGEYLSYPLDDLPVCWREAVIGVDVRVSTWVFDPQNVRLDQCFLEAILLLVLFLARGGTTRDAGLVVVSFVESC